MTKRRQIFSVLLAIVMCFTIFGSTNAMAIESEVANMATKASTKEKITESDVALKAIVQPRLTQIGQTLTGTLSPQIAYTGTIVVDKNYSNVQVYYATRLTSGSGTAVYKLTIDGPAKRTGNINVNGKADYITIGSLPKGTYSVKIQRLEGSTNAYYVFAMEFYQ